MKLEMASLMSKSESCDSSRRYCYGSRCGAIFRLTLFVMMCFLMQQSGATAGNGLYQGPLEKRQIRSLSVAGHAFSGGLYTGPYFDAFSPTNVTVQTGSTAVLTCRVRQAGNRSVSWVRKSDGHLLAVDEDVFISGGRFQAHRIEASDTWALQILLVTINDTADYECQVSAEPKISRIVKLFVVDKLSYVIWHADQLRWLEVRGRETIRLFFFAHPLVYTSAWKMLYDYNGPGAMTHLGQGGKNSQSSVEPLVRIKGAPDMFVKFGSSVTLHCHISGFLEHPGHVSWIFNSSRIAQLKSTTSSVTQGTTDPLILSAFNDNAGRSLILQRSEDNSLVSTLTLTAVSVEDSGQYTCAPANAPVATVTLHVLIGEHPAAMQHGENGLSTPSSLLLLPMAAIQWWCYHILNRP